MAQKLFRAFEIFLNSLSDVAEFLETIKSTLFNPDVILGRR